MRIYCGNLSYKATAEQIRGLFEQYGKVDAVDLMIDRDTGRSRGFAFVDMPDKDAREAMAALDGAEVDGRNLRVNEARARQERTGGGGGGGNRRRERSREDYW